MPHGCDDRAPLVYAGDEVVQLGVMREVEHGAVPTSQAYSIVRVRVYGPDGRSVFRSAMRSGLFSQDFALSLRNGNFRERGSKGTSPPTWTGDVLLETPLLKPIPSGRQPRKPQPRRVTVIVLTHIRHDVQYSFSHKPILAGGEHVLEWCLNIVYAEIPPKGYATR